jgi:hypothetical protein
VDDQLRNFQSLNFVIKLQPLVLPVFREHCVIRCVDAGGRSNKQDEDIQQGWGLPWALLTLLEPGLIRTPHLLPAYGAIHLTCNNICHILVLKHFTAFPSEAPGHLFVDLWTHGGHL